MIDHKQACEAFHANTLFLLKQRNWTLAELGRRSGYHPGTIRKIFYGISPTHTLLLVWCVAEALDVDPFLIMTPGAFS